MKRWKMPKEITNVEEPKFFTACMVGLALCVPFWAIIIYFIFS